MISGDMKAAGFDPVEVGSGYNGNDLNAYVEYCDERVALFARTLARGKHSVGYRLRAELSRRISALPAKASAVYAPERRANSSEFTLIVEDRQAAPGAPCSYERAHSSSNLLTRCSLRQIQSTGCLGHALIR